MSKQYAPLVGKAVWLRWIVIIGVLAALPLAFFRWETESASKKVELVFDYGDLIQDAALQSNPMQHMGDLLKKLKEAEVTSVSIDEITIEELRKQRRVILFTADQLGPIQNEVFDQNDTYIAFTNSKFTKAEELREWVRVALAAQNVGVAEWKVPAELRKNNTVVEQGLKVSKSLDDLTIRLLGNDPTAIQFVKSHDLQPVIRVSNQIKPFNFGQVKQNIIRWSEVGVERIIFAGEEVLGFAYESKNNKIKDVARLLDEYKIGIATIEMLKKPQLGLNTLAETLNYDVVRLHSLQERDPLLLQPNGVEARDQLVDRLALAVKDRGIRMIYLNARPIPDRERMTMVNPLPLIIDVLKGENGVIAQWRTNGMELGVAEAMENRTPLEVQGLQIFVALGALAFVTILTRYFIAISAWIVFGVGLIASIGLGFWSMDWLWKILALGAGVAAATCGILYVLHQGWISSVQKQSFGQTTISVFKALVTATIFSFAGSLLLIGLLNDFSYLLVLDQFRGVVLLHVFPMAFVAIYALLYYGTNSWEEVILRVKNFATTPVKVLGFVLFLIGAGAFVYYLTRTGNEGQVPEWERLYRTYLETYFGVRPRTKEFLLAHPLFIFAAVCWRHPKYRVAAVVFGALGQLSIIDTFAHLHTPIMISFERVLLGLLLGVILAVVYIIAWSVIQRSWNRWLKPNVRL